MTAMYTPAVFTRPIQRSSGVRALSEVVMNRSMALPVSMGRNSSRAVRISTSTKQITTVLM